MYELRILGAAFTVAVVIVLLLYLLPRPEPDIPQICSEVNYRPPPGGTGGWVLREHPSGRGCEWEPEQDSAIQHVKE